MLPVLSYWYKQSSLWKTELYISRLLWLVQKVEKSKCEEVASWTQLQPHSTCPLRLRSVFYIIPRGGKETQFLWAGVVAPPRLQRTWVHFPYIREHTHICNSNARGYKTLFQPPWALESQTHTHTRTVIHIHFLKFFFKNFRFSELIVTWSLPSTTEWMWTNRGKELHLEFCQLMPLMSYHVWFSCDKPQRDAYDQEHKETSRNVTKKGMELVKRETINLRRRGQGHISGFGGWKGKGKCN